MRWRLLTLAFAVMILVSLFGMVATVFLILPGAAERVTGLSYGRTYWLMIDGKMLVIWRFSQDVYKEVLHFPYWPAIPVAVAMQMGWIILYMRRKRGDIRSCNTCRYNLTGNTSGVCPECGAAIK